MQCLAKQNTWNENTHGCWMTEMGQDTVQDNEDILTHCGLVTPYDNIDLGQHL